MTENMTIASEAARTNDNAGSQTRQALREMRTASDTTDSDASEPRSTCDEIAAVTGCSRRPLLPRALVPEVGFGDALGLSHAGASSPMRSARSRAAMTTLFAKSGPKRPERLPTSRLRRKEESSSNRTPSDGSCSMASSIRACSSSVRAPSSSPFSSRSISSGFRDISFGSPVVVSLGGFQPRKSSRTPL